ncbi:hotdog domain-containing protein [Streptomyces sp. NPDC048417]|uniref:hotdog domain-containing protein n=1 Tax=Streptomyces sp. NPDC048417 TaxID=3155387 RepID=UPI003436FCF5
MPMTAAEADKIVSADFALRVLDPGLSVKSVGENRALPRPPWSDRLSREGGGLSGQALTAVADTAASAAVSAARGGFVPTTTVRRSTSSRRAVRGSDVLIEAVLSGLGRRTAFADITMSDERSGALAARAGTVHAFLG